MKAWVRKRNMMCLGIAACVIWLAVVANQPTAASSHCVGDCDRRAIDDRITVKVPDARLVAHIRGTLNDEPPLLWLHGGPGGAETPLFQLYAGALESDRLVIYFDQRGAGRSYHRASTIPLTVERHLSDLSALISYIRKRYNQDKVVLLGHSGGAALGILYAQRHPETLAGIVAINPLIDGLGSQRAQYDYVMLQASTARLAKTLKILEHIGPPPLSHKEVIRLQALVDEFGGYFHNQPNYLAISFKLIWHGLVSPWEIYGFIRANEISLEAMHEELQQLNLTDTVHTLKVPIATFLGVFDRQTNPSLAVDFMEALEAPQKRTVWFHQSAHNVPFEEPTKFLEKLRGILSDAEWK